MEQRRGIIPFSCASTILLSIYFPPFSFPGSREDPNSRGSPLTSSLLSPSPPPSPFAFSRSPFSAFSLLLRVSLRFFQSEPSSPPLTFVDGACPRRRSPSASSPVAASAHFHHPLRPLRIASLPSVPFALNIQLLSFFLFFSLSLSRYFSTIAVHLFLRLFLHCPPAFFLS